MKINDVLECANKALEIEREARLIEARGHFVFHINYTRLMGQFKEFKGTIEFIRYGIGDNGCPKKVLSMSHKTECPNDKIEEMKEKASVQLLTNFFTLIRLGRAEFDYDNFVKGTFNGIE